MTAKKSGFIFIGIFFEMYCKQALKSISELPLYVVLQSRSIVRFMYKSKNNEFVKAVR
jgi:hypothetical protein